MNAALAHRDRVDARHLLVSDLRSFGLDTLSGLEGPLSTIARGSLVCAFVAGERTARGRFVGWDEVSGVLWVAWHFDPHEESEEDREAFGRACARFDDLEGTR